MMVTRIPSALLPLALLILFPAPAVVAAAPEPDMPAADSAPAAHTNRLVDETSPYLLQHAHNPVDWYPWGEAAIEAARASDMPIFLSIGYSTCYWCHVMERESFENEDIAAIMNEHFICIKVDREERPDIDDIYMAATQIITGSGGWPMSVFIDPHTLKPFYAGTYFPPKPMGQRPSFPEILHAMAEAWTTQRDQIETQSEAIARRIETQLSLPQLPTPLSIDNVGAAVNALANAYDAKNGGFGGAPKFPQPVYLDLLMTASWDNDFVRRAVADTLDRMAMGGIYDQIGGGFHRYSVDAKWLVPHFEKMLYDNGQLLSTYARAYDLTGDPYYAEIMAETVAYLQREMQLDHGAFASAQDAEVNAREGLNYLWRPEQMRAALVDAGLEDDVEFALEAYGLSQGTNFQDPHHPEDGPTNVVHLPERPTAIAARLNVDPAEVRARLDRINAALLPVRDQREQPGRDDKVLAAWNGLAIAGLADAGRVLGDQNAIDAASRAADVILQQMTAADGSLLRSARNGRAKIEGFLEDYAYVIRGLLALHRATSDDRWLDHASELAVVARTQFRDDVAGGYFDTRADQSDLFVRTKSTHDGATPSANAVMANNLVTLYERTGDDAYLDEAIATLNGMSRVIAGQPVGATNAVRALYRVLAIAPDRMTSAAETGPLPPQPVVATASRGEVVMTPETPGVFDLTIEIADGFHINAHEPGDDALIGLRVVLTGAQGLALDADYPEGEAYGTDGEIRVHRGTITIPVRVRLTGPLQGRPSVLVVFQACTDRACLAPMQQRVAVELQLKPGQ